MNRTVAMVFAGLLACFSSGVAQAEIKTQWVDYKEGDTALQGYLAYDDGISGKRPGILLLHRRDGMSDLTLANAKMYASKATSSLPRIFLARIFVPRPCRKCRRRPRSTPSTAR